MSGGNDFVLFLCGPNRSPGAKKKQNQWPWMTLNGVMAVNLHYYTECITLGSGACQDQMTMWWLNSDVTVQIWQTERPKWLEDLCLKPTNLAQMSQVRTSRFASTVFHFRSTNVPVGPVGTVTRPLLDWREMSWTWNESTISAGGLCLAR